MAKKVIFEIPDLMVEDGHVDKELKDVEKASKEKLFINNEEILD